MDSNKTFYPRFPSKYDLGVQEFLDRHGDHKFFSFRVPKDRERQEKMLLVMQEMDKLRPDCKYIIVTNSSTPISTALEKPFLRLFAGNGIDDFIKYKWVFEVNFYSTFNPLVVNQAYYLSEEGHVRCNFNRPFHIAFIKSKLQLNGVQWDVRPYDKKENSDAF